MAENEPCVTSCIGSSLELQRDLRCFGKPITVLFNLVSVAGRDYGFLRWPSDLPSGLVKYISGFDMPDRFKRIDLS